MTFRTTEISAFAGGLRWSSCSSLEGDKQFVPVAVQVLAVNTFVCFVTIVCRTIVLVAVNSSLYDTDCCGAKMAEEFLKAKN